MSYSRDCEMTETGKCSASPTFTLKLPELLGGTNPHEQGLFGGVKSSEMNSHPGFLWWKLLKGSWILA